MWGHSLRRNGQDRFWIKVPAKGTRPEDKIDRRRRDCEDELRDNADEAEQEDPMEVVAARFLPERSGQWT